MYFSDVYADKPIPAEVRGYKQLWGNASHTSLIMHAHYMLQVSVTCYIQQSPVIDC